MTFKRLHRYRQSQPLRNLLEETSLSVSQFIYPLFISETIDAPVLVQSLPGVFQHTLTSVLDEVEECVRLGISAFLLFGIPHQKDACGTGADDKHGVIQQTIRAIKERYPETVLLADCCLCEYTDHGHCGIITQKDQLLNDETLTRLQSIAVSYAQAGVDIVAPSGMMDGMVSAIRQGLDKEGYGNVSIMSYAVKYASHLYGPFRDAAGSTFTSNRKHHQLNPTQRKEALMEAVEDEKEGADFIIIKPAGFYLDIIRDVAESTLLPLVAYQVSGEYSMLKLAAKQGICDEEAIFKESFLSMKRAGATLIISYYVKEMAKWINKQ